MPVTIISEARRAASRANGAKSRGPITPEGKATSAKNAIRHHGLTIRALTLPAECPDAAAELLAAYTADLNPDGPVEHDIVEMLTVYKWQMLRVQSMQRGFLVNAETRHAAFIKDHLNEADPSSFAAENFRHANLEDETFRHLIRYASELRRAFSATLRDLRLVQGPRFKGNRQENEPEPKLQTIENEALPSAPSKTRAEIEPEPAPQTPRNALCPCGSGAKYKRCCGPKAPPVLGIAA